MIQFYALVFVQLIWWLVVAYGCVVLRKNQSLGVLLIVLASLVLAILKTSTMFFGYSANFDSHGSLVSEIEPLIPFIISGPLEKVALVFLVGGILLLFKDISNRSNPTRNHPRA